jgi:hypothetical protein
LKLKDIEPVPKRFAPSWSAPISVNTIDIGGKPIQVSIYLPAVAIASAANIPANVQTV